MIRQFIRFLFLFHVSLFAFSQEQPINDSERINNAIYSILTTKTGCEIGSKFFLLKPKNMAKFFGMNDFTSEKVSAACSKYQSSFFSLFHTIPPSSRSDKKYVLEKKLSLKFEHLMSWTDPDNTTYIFDRPGLSNLDIQKIISHEIAITMDDKFNILTKDFKFLGLQLNLSSEQECKINRFLHNPFYQIGLASLRAFIFEKMFAKDLNNYNWSNELNSYIFLQEDSVKNLQSFISLISGHRLDYFKLVKVYSDPCSGLSISTEALSSNEIDQIIERDWFELVNSLDEVNLKELIDFLIKQIAISSSDVNIKNHGPRPVIGTDGWSAKSDDSRRVPIREKVNGVQSWEQALKSRLPMIIQVPTEQYIK